MNLDDDLQALENDRTELEDLERLIGEFNVFEAMRVTDQELSHSNFLAFLLDPQENHGLDDAFARLLLSKAMRNNLDKVSVLTLQELAAMSLREMNVYREAGRIDILLVDQANSLVIVIENKVHSGQGLRQGCVPIVLEIGWPGDGAGHRPPR